MPHALTLLAPTASVTYVSTGRVTAIVAGNGFGGALVAVVIGLIAVVLESLVRRRSSRRPTSGRPPSVSERRA